MILNNSNNNDNSNDDDTINNSNSANMKKTVWTSSADVDPHRDAKCEEESRFWE